MDLDDRCGCIGCRHHIGTAEHRRLAADCIDCYRWEYLALKSIEPGKVRS